MEEVVGGAGGAPQLAEGTTAESPSTKRNAWDSYDTVFLNAKAGMDGVDKKKVQKVVYDMSKGSRYFDNEQRKDKDVARKIDSMRAAAASLTPAQLALHEKATDMKLIELEAGRDLSRIWMHVDMDAFYAAVETLVNPTLAGKPMAVGGISMICTANYEARKFGVRAAMPGFIARKLCADLIFMRPDFKKYSYYSELSRKVFKDYDPDFVARSMDEAYIDITKACQMRNMSGGEIAEELRRRVQSETGLTCSAGVGPNRLLAKVCSDINKPNGQHVLSSERGAVMAFMSSLPIRKVSGIGKVTERLLKDVLGITTCADLLDKRAYLPPLFSEISTNFFLSVALGIGGSETPEKEPRKSLSNERTFAAICDEHQIFKKLEELVDLLVKDMEKEGLEGRTLTLKLKETGFEVRSRAVTLPSFVSGKAEIWEHAAKLLRPEFPLSLRLMGLRISHFKGEQSGPADRFQRTLTGFVTQTSPASGIKQRQASQGSHKDNSLTSKMRLDFPIDFHRKGEEQASAQNGASASKIVEKANPDIASVGVDSSCMASITAKPQSAIASDLQSRSGDSPFTFSYADQERGAWAVPRQLTESPCSALTEKAGLPLKQDGTELSGCVLRKDESSKPQQNMGRESSHVVKDTAYERAVHLLNIRPLEHELDPAVTHAEESTSKANIDRQVATRADLRSNCLNTDQTDREAPSSIQLHDRGTPATTNEELEITSDAMTMPLAMEPSWQELQSGYDESQDEQVWASDNNRCQLCGEEVGSLPAARQEHEDFHFALWLQQQKEEKSDLPRVSTVAVASNKPSRELSSAGRKRKASAEKRSHNNTKGYSYRPLDAFFSKGR